MYTSSTFCPLGNFKPCICINTHMCCQLLQALIVAKHMSDTYNIGWNLKNIAFQTRKKFIRFLLIFELVSHHIATFNTDSSIYQFCRK